VHQFNRFLAHHSANVGSSHSSRYQRCAILYVRRSLCRRLRPVSARVRSLVVESYLGCGRCWLNTPLWPSNLSLDGRALVAASVQSAPSDVLIRFRSMPDIPAKVSLAWGARWRWNSLVPRDPPTPSQSPCYHTLVPTRSQWSSGNTLACGARGPRFASRCGQKFVFSRESLRYAALGTGCTLTAVPRSTQPSTLRGTVNEYQPYG